ncbi:uncharacterized protein LOC120342255 [Styela clava]
MNASSRRSPYRGRRRDRSTSEERPRTRTYDPSETDYSDDFEPDAISKNATPPPKRRGGNARGRRHDSGSYYTDQSSTSHLHSSGSKKSTQSVARGLKGQKKSRPRYGWKSNNSGKPESIRAHRDNITTRMLSAKQRKINELQNELVETEHRLDGMLKENKLLKTVQHRQDKALKRFQDVESDLPRLIAQNFEDQRVLKTRLKKAQEAERILEEKLHENNDEMQKMEKTLRKLKKVVYDKNLGERSELARQLTNTENNLTVAERKVKELEKKLELTTNSFSRQIKSERQKHKETKEKLDALTDDYQTVQSRLKEKERALNVSNIYALRNKEQSAIKSIQSTPRKHFLLNSTFTQTEAPLPLTFHSNNATVKPTQMGLRRKESPSERKKDRTKPTENHSDFRSSPSNSSPVPTANTMGILTSSPTTNGLHSTTGHVSKEQSKTTDQHAFLTSHPLSNSSTPTHSMVADSIEFEKPATQFEPSYYESSSLRSNVKVEEEKQNSISEIKKQQKLEEERRRLAEEQKKKNALLAKMREIEHDEPNSLPLESNKNSSISPAPLSFETIKNPPIPSKVTMHPKSKAELVKSLLGTDTNDSDPVVENLHMGLPSNPKKVEKPEKELSFGGYAPSVGTTQASRKPVTINKKPAMMSSDSDNDEPMFDLDSGTQNKKSDLLSQLFGEQSTDKLKNDSNESLKANGTGGTTPRAKPVHSGYPWEKNVVTTNHVNGHVSSKTKTGVPVKATPSIHEDDIEELVL